MSIHYKRILLYTCTQIIISIPGEEAGPPGGTEIAADWWMWLGEGQDPWPSGTPGGFPVESWRVMFYYYCLMRNLDWGYYHGYHVYL